MARTLNTVVHATRREAFVDAAEALIKAKGYEQMTIQDILDELDAAKGAFYHYFDSKADLLDAVVERMVATAMATMSLIVADPELSALQKLGGVFSAVGRYKSERVELLVALLRVWLADDNAIVREKLRVRTAKQLAPLLAAIVAQGNAEGRFAAGDPEQIGRVLVSLLQGLNEVAIELYFARQAGTISLDDVERALGAYTEALDRILGIPSGSFAIVDRATLRQWYG